MSLNHFTLPNQSDPQPFLNPRFNSLIIDNQLEVKDLVVDNDLEVKGDLKVDGSMEASGLSYPTADNGVSYIKSNGAGVLTLEKTSYGTVGYKNALVTYAVPVTTSQVVVSLNRNYASPNYNITLNPIGIQAVATKHYLISGTVSFNSDTPGTEYGVSIEVNSVPSMINYSAVSGSFAELSISEIRNVNAGELVTINLIAVAGITNVNVVSWNLTIKNVD